MCKEIDREGERETSMSRVNDPFFLRKRIVYLGGQKQFDCEEMI